MGLDGGGGGVGEGKVEENGGRIGGYEARIRAGEGIPVVPEAYR